MHKWNFTRSSQIVLLNLSLMSALYKCSFKSNICSQIIIFIVLNLIYMMSVTCLSLWFQVSHTWWVIMLSIFSHLLTVQVSSYEYLNWLFMTIHDFFLLLCSIVYFSALENILCELQETILWLYWLDTSFMPSIFTLL